MAKPEPMESLAGSLATLIDLWEQEARWNERMAEALPEDHPNRRDRPIYERTRKAYRKCAESARAALERARAVEVPDGKG